MRKHLEDGWYCEGEPHLHILTASAIMALVNIQGPPTTMAQIYKVPLQDYQWTIQFWRGRSPRALFIWNFMTPAVALLPEGFLLAESIGVCSSPAYPGVSGWGP